ncbi:MAG: sigma 54-interacting transcriptional regulator [bacterium]|nr:MAG: sigma 54-interacting transcriptional regulator [bacterium]
MNIDINQYQQLLKISKELLVQADIDHVLTISMDRLIEISGAERGIIILFDEAGESLFQTARQLEQKDIEHPEFEISRTIIEQVRSSEQPLYLPNAMEHHSMKKSNSVDELRLLSVICLPLVHQKKLFGVIYLDNRTVEGAFQSDTFAFVQSFADFISLAAYHALERKQLENRKYALEEELRTRYDFDAIVCHSPQMIQVLQTVSQVADTDVPVLVEGESGTGKELIARALHYNSQRRQKPLLTVNCAAFPDDLLESEFFGHEKGAFTGAFKARKGKFEVANGSTIFLDEIDEMSPALQVKLLRVIQWGEFTPLGSDETRKSDVRIVAACKTPLKSLVESGKFREDLYYRLHVFCIKVPPLRERKEDIILLAEHFLKDAAIQMQKDLPILSAIAKQTLQHYSFPGNVRELENIIRRAVILCKGKTIEPEYFPEEITKSSFKFEQDDTSQFPTFKQAKQKIVDEFERQYLLRVLHESNGIIAKAAQLAGMHTKNFHQKLNKHNIHINKTNSK